MLTAIRNWVIRTMMKAKGETGIVKTLPKKEIVEMNTQITAQRLMHNGIDPRSLKNADQVENAIIAIENRANVQTGFTTKKSADVFDLEGKKIDTSKGIMGGRQIDDLPPGDPDLPPPGSRGGPDDIAAPFQSAEETIKNIIEAENKKGITRIRARQKMVDDAIDNMSPSLSGDTRTDAVLVAEDLAERMGLVYDDLPIREQTKLYDQAYQGLSKMRFEARQTPKGAPPKITSKKDADSQESSYDDGPADFDPDADNETFAQGGRAGFFMGSPNPRGLGLLRQILNYMSKKGKETGGFKGADLSGLDMLRLSNPKALNKLLADVRGKVNIREGIMGTDTVRAQQQALRGQRKGLTEKSLDVAKAMKDDQDRIAKRIDAEAKKTIIPETKRMLMEGMGMSEDVAQRMAEDMAKAAKNIKPINAPPEITDEGLLQLENVLKNLETGGKKKRELNATGGRTGFKDGMTRRTFLKLLGGVMSIPIIGKVIAPLKLAKGVKKVPIIKTDNVPGKPEWFDALVNKVIIEGDDVTKRFATGERQRIHQKTLDDGSVVRVTEDVDDGAVRVEYQSEQNVFGDDVMLQYKKPLPDETDPRPSARFDVAESGPVGRVVGPDDVEIDVDEVGGTSIRDLDSDVSKLKEYATGQKPTMKELVQNIKRQKRASDITDDIDGAASDAVVRRQGDYDPSDYDDFASGGIARLLGE